MKNHPKEVQNYCYANFSKIRTKSAVFKSYFTLLGLSCDTNLWCKSKGVKERGLKT